jgi:hypothetical protein
MKMTSNGRCSPMEFNGRRPSIEDDLQWKITFNGRRPSMKDNLQK